MSIRKSLVVVAALGAILLLGGCQKSPDKEVIVNKNDESFASNVAASTGETNPSIESYQTPFFDSFASTDESVHFSIAVDQSFQTSNTPIVQVSSHFLTEEDAKRVATAFFPDATFFEAEPPQAEKLSKSEIQEKINRWAEYVNTGSLKTLYGDMYSDMALNDISNTIKNFVENYTIMYETAPTENCHTLCEWKMHKTLEYLLSPEELIDVDISNSNDEISAQFIADNIPYYFTAATRNNSDFKVNMISIYVYAGMGPANLDENIFHAQLTRTAEPTQSQIDMVKSKAEQMLSEMDLGEWQIDECFVETKACGEATEYTILVNAVPSLGNVQTLRRPQLTRLKNKDGYAPEQYYTDANFAFSADGRLISFNLYTPIETQKVVNDNAEVMDMAALVERAKEHLCLTDSYAYGFGDFLPFIEEDVQCNVTISELIYGLSRIKVQNEEDVYYYVPSMLLKGDVEYVGKESGSIFYSSTETEDILYINAIDGTIINQTNS